MPDSDWRICWPDPKARDGLACVEIPVKLVHTEPDPTIISPSIDHDVWGDLGVVIAVAQVAMQMKDEQLRARLVGVAEELVIELGKKLPSEVVLKQTG
jgi:hypothetical protein